MSVPYRLAVVVVNYRTPDLVRDCLRSLAPEIDPDQDRVVIVDNDSKDDSVEILGRLIEEEAWGEWVRIVEAEDNGGFSSGNNVGIEHAKAKTYLLLNSDTRVRPGALSALLECLHDHPEVGIVGPRLEGRDGSTQVSAFRFLSPLSEFIRGAETGPVTRLLHRFNVPMEITDGPFACDWASFAAVAIRSEVFEEVGLMDEGYFMYFEDVDYCRRAKKGGWSTMYWPKATVVHFHGGTSSVERLNAARKRKPRYYYAARTRYFSTFYGKAGCWLANILWMAGLGISFLRQLIKPRKMNVCEKELIDIWVDCLRTVHPVSKRDATDVTR